MTPYIDWQQRRGRAADLAATPIESYPEADRNFYRFWYAHMLDDLMQPPLAGISHRDALYIWDAAIAAVEAAKPAAPASFGPMTDAESNLWHHGYACGQADVAKPVPIKAGDHVHHHPTGEDWVVKAVRGDKLEWAGWPPNGRANVSDCTLIRAAPEISKPRSYTVGYSTDFEGELKFQPEITVPQLAKLQAMLEEDCRDHPEWIASKGLYYIDLELTKNFSGLKWNGAEKTYGMESLVNVVILNMRAEFPDFGLSGSMLAQGEDVKDRWSLMIGADGLAQKVPVSVAVVTCPHCGEQIATEGPARPRTEPDARTAGSRIGEQA